MTRNTDEVRTHVYTRVTNEVVADLEQGEREIVSGVQDCTSTACAMSAPGPIADATHGPLTDPKRASVERILEAKLLFDFQLVHYPQLSHTCMAIGCVPMCRSCVTAGRLSLSSGPPAVRGLLTAP